MKKLFAIAIIAATLAACNNSSEGSGTGDSTSVAPDTSSMMSTPDTSMKMAPDTTQMADTSAKK
jgi:hypothetical protein